VQDWTISNNVFRDCNQTKSGSCIKTNYCPTGAIVGNTIDGSSGTGAAISIFGNGAISISNNRIQNNAGGGISASSLGSVNIHDNICNLISYTSITNSLIHHNNTSASGITGSGTNTGTNVSSNLQGGTFA
jgi:hypothetical protein